MSAAWCTAAGVQTWIGGTDIGAVGGWGVESIFTNSPSHHKSSKQCLLIAYLKTSGVNGSKTT